MFRDSQETASEHRGNKKNRIETSVSADAVAMHKCLNTLWACAQDLDIQGSVYELANCLLRSLTRFGSPPTEVRLWAALRLKYRNLLLRFTLVIPSGITCSTGDFGARGIRSGFSPGVSRAPLGLPLRLVDGLFVSLHLIFECWGRLQYLWRGLMITLRKRRLLHWGLKRKKEKRKSKWAAECQAFTHSRETIWDTSVYFRPFCPLDLNAYWIDHPHDRISTHITRTSTLNERRVWNWDCISYPEGPALVYDELVVGVAYRTLICILGQMGSFWSNSLFCATVSSHRCIIFARTPQCWIPLRHISQHLSFFLGFRRPNLITGLSGWRTPD